MFSPNCLGISGKVLKSVFCLVLVLSPAILSAEHNRQFVYVANENSATISGFLLHATTGKLTPLQGSPFPTDSSGLGSIAVDPAGRFLYAANQSGGTGKNVTGFRIDDETGRLIALPGSPFDAGLNPSSIAIDPSGRFAYVSDYGGNMVSALKIDQHAGRLQLIASYPTGGSPNSITVDAQGKFVYVTNQATNNISGYTVNATSGALTEIAGSPFPGGTFPVSIAVDPNERFVYVANQGSNNVWGYSINAMSGALSPLSTSPYAAGNGALSVTVGPTGGVVYVAGSTGVSAYQIDQNITDFGGGGFPPKDLYGGLTLIQGSPFGAGSLNFVTVDYTGTFLYAANQSSNDVLSFNLGSTPISSSPFPTGSGPVSIALVRPQTFPLFTAALVPPNTDFGSTSAVVASGVNDLGQVAGTATFYPNAGEQFAEAFLYAGGVSKGVAFSRFSTGNGLNNKGQVVGQQDVVPPLPQRPPQQAFLFSHSNNSLVDIDNVPGRQSDAISINDAGQVTGSLSTGTCPAPFSMFPACLGSTHAFIYTGSGLVDLGTLGGTDSVGTGINDHGDVVGSSQLANGETHLFLYSQGHMNDLGTPAGQSVESAKINDHGDILVSTSGVGSGSYLHRGHSFSRLPFAAASINNSSEIVGSKSDATGSLAYVYFRGVAVDLNRLVDPSLPLLTTANGVSNNGKIVVHGLNGQLYVLTPK